MAANPAAREASRHAKSAAVSMTFALALSVLAGCSKSSPPPEPPKPPPPPPPTKVSVEISAAADANPTPEGQGAPVLIRIYQLADKPAFEGAEFYQLYHSDAATLGADLIKKDEILLSPSTSRTLSLMPADTVHVVGIFAAYADFQHATWRADADVPAHQTTTISVTADRSGIKLTAKSEKPAGP